MKKLLSFILLVTLFASCSSDDNEPTQDYTSFVFEQTIDNSLPNCVAGYKKDGKYFKLGNLGTLDKKNQQSPEIIINDQSINEVYFFSDHFGCIMTDHIFTLKANTKNVFKLLETYKGIQITDKTDPTQYPQ